MNIAVVDIGTNTVLLLVASFDQQGRITPLAYEQRIPRLGKGVDARKTLSHDAMQRVAEVLKEYRPIMARFNCAATVVCGTSAVRDASNRDEFAALLRREAGVTLEVLSGTDEARWTYLGAVSGTDLTGGATVLDIGGGSTELTRGDGHEIAEAVSVDIGSVRLTERLFHHDPLHASELEAARHSIHNALGAVHNDFQNTSLIAVAGTATTLALLAQERRVFDINAVSGYHMARQQVAGLLKTLSGMSNAQRFALGDYMEGRGDIITAGALILHEIMERFDFPEVTVSERGVRYGLAIREWERLTQEGPSA